MVIGKVLGVLGGLILNWFPQGVIIGLIVGILVDELLLKKMVRKSKETFWMQEFSCLYLEVLASIAVSKGRITKEDILCIREHAYIPGEHNPIANRILKQAKKSRKTYNYLLSEILSCCEGAEDMLEIIAQGAVSVGALQGIAGRNKVDKLFHEFGLPPVNWSQASSFKGQQKSSAQSSRKKQKAEAYNQEDDPLVTRAYGNKSPYAVLGVKKTATAAEIKKAYRSLIQKHHPDRVRAKSQSDKAVEKAEKKVAEINAAYEVLQKKKRP